jgi:putative glutamine amidotransferase
MNATRPLIGIMARAFAVPGRSDSVAGVFASYVECVYAAGGHPLAVPPASAGAVAMLNGLLLAGGEDIASSALWSAGGPAGPVDHDRDVVEQAACLLAREQNIPTFGICRGAQVMSCVLGGEIARFAEEAAAAHTDVDKGHGREHGVDVVPETTLSQLVGGAVNMRVVSRHNCFISTLGRGLRPAAVAEDGTVEAFDSTSWTCLGVQWHPEWHGPSVPRDLRPFAWLVQQAQERMRK